MSEMNREEKQTLLSLALKPWQELTAEELEWLTRNSERTGRFFRDLTSHLEHGVWRAQRYHARRRELATMPVEELEAMFWQLRSNRKPSSDHMLDPVQVATHGMPIDSDEYIIEQLLADHQSIVRVA